MADGYIAPDNQVVANYGSTGDISFGWTCASCGGYTPHNETHQCPNLRNGSIGNLDYLPSRNIDNEIVALLNRIADILEKIEKKS